MSRRAGGWGPRLIINIIVWCPNDAALSAVCPQYMKLQIYVKIQQTEKGTYKTNFTLLMGEKCFII